MISCFALKLFQAIFWKQYGQNLLRNPPFYRNPPAYHINSDSSLYYYTEFRIYGGMIKFDKTFQSLCGVEDFCVFTTLGQCSGLVCVLHL